MNYLLGAFISLLSFSCFAVNFDVYDKSRDRHIPISVTYPENDNACQSNSPCEVVFISAGNRVPYEKYAFLIDRLSVLGYLVVAIDHELPADPPLSITGDLYKTRIENWQRGAKTLNFVHDYLSKRFPNYDFNNLTLVGHSNGGDISTWLTKEEKSYVKRLITLDHKRVAFPKKKNLKVLSVRAAEYPTMEGVLLNTSEQKMFGVCVIEIPNSKHMDLTDYGPESIKKKVCKMVEKFLLNETCSSIKKA